MFRFRASMLIFIIGLVLSGLTAFPLLHEMRLLSGWMKAADGVVPAALSRWIETIKAGLEHMHAHYPWAAYGTDWLAFGHLVIALFFIRPLIDPLTSRANIHVGIVACIAIVPLAMICGPIRGIPFYWQLIDCSFGIIGLIPLLYCLRQLKQIEVRHSPENDLATSPAVH